MKCSDFESFELSHPFTPFQHLVCCLPPQSASFLPPSYAALLTDPDSPLHDYYPSQFARDKNGKRKDYEAVVILPFIDEARVLKVIQEEKCDDGLTEAEKERNSPEKECLMEFCESSPVFRSPLMKEYFPDLIDCHCRSTELGDLRFVYERLRETVKQDKTAVFSSIYPQCVSIRHPKAKEQKKEKKFQLTDSVQSVVEVDFSNYPFINNAESLKELARRYCGKCVIFGYPQHKIALVTGFYTYEFGCECVPDPGKKPEEWVHAYVLPKVKKERIKEEMNALRTLAMNGNKDNGYEVGSLDIGDNSILVRLRPVYHLTRRQEDAMVLPLFLNQFIYYPFCLTRLAKNATVTGGGLSLTALGAYEMKEGDEVVYAGSQTLQERSLWGCKGVVKRVSGNTVVVAMEAQLSEAVEREVNRAWYTEEDVRGLLKKEYQPFLHACLGRLYVKNKPSNVIFTLNLAYATKGLVREGLARQRPRRTQQRNATLPAQYYALLATSIDDAATEEKPVVEYSSVAVAIVKDYFSRFGADLVKNITMDKMKPEVKTMTLEKATEMATWVAARVGMHSFVTLDTITATASYRKKLENRDCGRSVLEIGPISDKTVKVELECEKKELLIREPQYNIVSDLILQQPTPSVGDQVVVVQHATIPFGTRAVVTSVSVNSMWMELLLDKPCIAGVTRENVVDASYCIGNVV